MTGKRKCDEAEHGTRAQDKRQAFARNQNKTMNLGSFDSFADTYPPIEDLPYKLRLGSVSSQDGVFNENDPSCAKNAADLIFDAFKSQRGEICINKFLMALRMTGLRKRDPRLKEMIENFERIHKERIQECSTIDPYNLIMDRDSFTECIRSNLVLLMRAFRHQLVIPDWPEFCRQIEHIYLKCKKIKDGKVATYIPQLARVNPDYWGVSVCTIDGQRCSWGDYSVPWCLQSVSKPLTYAIALQEYGADFVHNYVGQEPSGRLFNEICLDHNSQPHNPMINAGAIVVSSLIKRDEKLSDRFDFIIKKYRQLAGKQYVGFSNTTFLSERDTADRNNALAYYMREHKCFPKGVNLKDVLDLYFQLCSVEVTCESAAIMAATLANGGVCPMTNEKLFSNKTVRDVLSLMYSCGMYDYSGQFAFRIGLPAKSGVSGGMILVIPNVMGFAIWAPPLDRLGNTVKGVSFSKELVDTFNFHNYDNLVHSDSHKLDPRKKATESEEQQMVGLLYAVRDGNIHAIRRYVLQGLDLNKQDYDGRTPLHIAASSGQTEVVKFLLFDCYVKTDPKDRWHRTPLDDARYFGHKECANLIEEFQNKFCRSKSTLDVNNLNNGNQSPNISKNLGSDSNLGEKTKKKVSTLTRMTSNILQDWDEKSNNEFDNQNASGTESD